MFSCEGGVFKVALSKESYSFLEQDLEWRRKLKLVCSINELICCHLIPQKQAGTLINLKGVHIIKYHTMKMCVGGGVAPHTHTKSILKDMSCHVHALAVLCLGEQSPVPVRWEAVWESKPVWTWWKREKSLSQQRIIHFVWPTISSEAQLM
jgi:hypothetical protein